MILLLLFDSCFQFLSVKTFWSKISKNGYKLSGFFGENLILGSF